MSNKKISTNSINLGRAENKGLLVSDLYSSNEDNIMAKVGRASLKTGFFLARYKPVLGIGLNLLFLLAVSAFPALAQGPNPWGGSGTTRLANAGSNILVLGTWVAFFIGILSFVLIPLFIKFEWNYKKLILSGLTGLGGFTVFGAIAYDLVNLSSMTMPDPTIGR